MSKIKIPVSIALQQEEGRFKNFLSVHLGRDGAARHIASNLRGTTRATATLWDDRADQSAPHFPCDLTDQQVIDAFYRGEDGDLRDDMTLTIEAQDLTIPIELLKTLIAGAEASAAPGSAAPLKPHHRHTDDLGQFIGTSHFGVHVYDFYRYRHDVLARYDSEPSHYLATPFERLQAASEHGSSPPLVWQEFLRHLAIFEARNAALTTTRPAEPIDDDTAPSP